MRIELSRRGFAAFGRLFVEGATRSQAIDARAFVYAGFVIMKLPPIDGAIQRLAGGRDELALSERS
jgi:hypothetical protein